MTTGNNDLALALVVQANNIDNPPAHSQAALSSIAYTRGTRRLYSVADSLNWAGSAAYSLHLNRVASGGSAVFVWDAATGELVRSLEQHQNRVLDVAFSPDSRWLLSGAQDGSVILWHTRTWSVEREFFVPDAVNAVAFSHDNRTLLAATGRLNDSGHNDIILWDTKTGREIRRLKATPMRFWMPYLARMIRRFYRPLGIRQ